MPRIPSNRSPNTITSPLYNFFSSQGDASRSVPMPRGADMSLARFLVDCDAPPQIVPVTPCPTRWRSPPA
ncbi:hypothetical protein T4B_1902 [Trichinella pseudospiralis]|uniref:Uncharacterized protein n=1 Tax=Trichinella pseudospiralis TaxID=6337 RepID=A0A0V1JI08_TRIPS|nr:hypothetical protein T4B_3073 [Trichinella pseudospiralis]KRZ34149.1 hypothetical protein T4B_1902 [Trichinella pseudospiralis]KRZ44974.1 hypothetical protein T4C_4683 [Trichinella pseudospiralis]